MLCTVSQYKDDLFLDVMLLLVFGKARYGMVMVVTMYVHKSHGEICLHQVKFASDGTAMIL